MLITLSRRTAICQSVDRCGSPEICKPPIYFFNIRNCPQEDVVDPNLFGYNNEVMKYVMN